METRLTRTEKAANPAQETSPMRPEVTPRTWLNESVDDYTLHVDLPGVGDGELHLDLADRTLTLRAEPAEVAHPEHRMVRQEFPPVRYQTSFELPERIDTAAIRANLDKGVLKLTLPKREEVKPRRIAVTAT